MNTKYDDIITGFGKGGKTIAGALANTGWKVVLIEKSDMMYGGTCINVGCMPTKSLVHSAQNAVTGGTDNKKVYQLSLMRIPIKYSGHIHSARSHMKW